MIKNNFSVTVSSDGSVVLASSIFFNKMESGVTKLSFTLPDMDGYPYLLCRHDRKAWYSIPILEDDDGNNYVLVGQTVTRQHGRWAFNVAITETELSTIEREEDAIFISDVFEGLVYDNIVGESYPATAEPNVLKLGNDCKYLYELLAAKQEIIEADIVTANVSVANLATAVQNATAKATEASQSATASATSASNASESASASATSATASATSATESSGWARDSFTSSQVARDKANEAKEYAIEASQTIDTVRGYAQRAEDAMTAAESDADRAEEAADAAEESLSSLDDRMTAIETTVGTINEAFNALYR